MARDRTEFKPIDKAEGAELVRRYREPLLRFFRRRGVSNAAAEDLSQECFTRIFALADRRHIENEEAYLFQIAANVLTDDLRRASARQAAHHVSLDAKIHAPQVEEPGPDRVLEGKEALAQFAAALAELKPKTREIFLLNRLDGLTYTQIAVRFGLTPSAIEKHMIRALAHLNNTLGERRR